MVLYAEATAELLFAELHRNPVLYCPLGALEWHGPHLPLGLDGFIAEAFVERLATRVGGVVMPGVWLPMTTLPHKASLQVRTDTAERVWTDLVAMARQLEARVLCLVTGHYAHGHMIELQRLAVGAMVEDASVAVLAATPLEFLEKDELLDHAARWETAQLMAIRPDLVDLERLRESPAPADSAVLGDSPRLATLQDGDEALDSGLQSWQARIAETLESGDLKPLLQFYDRRLRRYDEYVRRYYHGSWEDAILAWWRDRAS